MTITVLQGMLRGLELEELWALLIEVKMTILDKQEPTKSEVTAYLRDLAKTANPPVERADNSAVRAGDSSMRAEVRRIIRPKYRSTAEERLDAKLARTLRKLQREHTS